MTKCLSSTRYFQGKLSAQLLELFNKQDHIQNIWVLDLRQKFHVEQGP